MATEKQKPERSVTLWQPFREMEEMGRRFEDFFNRPFLPASWRRLASDAYGWSPASGPSDKIMIS